MSENSNVEPLRRGDIKRREIYEEVGKAIVGLSDIENWVASIYHTYASPECLSDHELMKFFHDQGGFEKKLRLTSLIVRMFAEGDHRERWFKIIKDMEEHRKTRNLIAHQGLSVYGWGENEEVVLGGQWLRFDERGNPKGKRLKLEEIRATASALDGYCQALEKLWWDIEEYLYPSEKWDIDEEQEED